MIVLVYERHTTSYKRGVVVAHFPWLSLQWLLLLRRGVFRDRLSRELAKVAWKRYKVGAVDTYEILPAAGQCVFVQTSEIYQASDVLDGVTNLDCKGYFEAMKTVKKIAASSVCDAWQGIWRVCEYGGEALPTTVVEAIEPARDGI